MAMGKIYFDVVDVASEMDSNTYSRRKNKNDSELCDGNHPYVLPLICATLTESEAKKVGTILESKIQSIVSNSASNMHFGYLPIPYREERKTLRTRIQPQRRPGTHHGGGGRPRMGNVIERSKSLILQVQNQICRTILNLYGGRQADMASVVAHLVSALGQNVASREPDVLPMGSNDAAVSVLSSFIQSKPKKGCETIPGPFLCVSTKSYGSSMPGLGNAMDRHIACTWLDSEGGVSCTCIGSTKYRIASTVRSNCGIYLNGGVDCLHVRAFAMVIEKLSNIFNTAMQRVSRALAETVEHACDMNLVLFKYSLPKIVSAHDQKVNIFTCLEPGPSNFVQFVPVRCVKRGKNTYYVCAFCDLGSRGFCHHTRGMAIEQDVSQREPLQKWNGDFEHIISKLPLSPVNCSKAVQVDQEVCKSACSGDYYVITAPLRCYCGSHRNEKTFKSYSEGTILCSMGPCKLRIDTYTCNNSTCGKTVQADGRNEGILIYNLTSAGTHAFLRREVMGVVLSNGTIVGRLRHFHSQVISNMQAGIIPVNVPSRSVRIMEKLCSSMLRLMNSQPPPSLFRCQTCEFDGAEARERLLALCIDGICQGYSKLTEHKFTNISEDCKALGISQASGVALHKLRPLNGLIRRQKTVDLLMLVLKGKNLTCSFENVRDIAAVVRCFSHAILPAHFCSESICGRSNTDYFNDLGAGCALERIRGLTNSIFDQRLVLIRLLVPLKDFLDKAYSEGHENKLIEIGALPRPENSVRKRRRIQSTEEAIGGWIRTVTRAEQNAAMCKQICWTELLFSSIEQHEAVLKKDIMLLFTLFIQGPITQFVQKGFVQSLQQLSTICLEETPNELLSVLQDVSQGLENSSTSLLSQVRLLQSGLFSVVEIETTRSLEAGKKIRNAFGHILNACTETVKAFYSFYDNCKGNSSATAYATKWNSSSVETLRTKLDSEYPQSHEKSFCKKGSTFDIAMRTGNFFPAHPQLRPLPFNTEDITEVGGTARDSVTCSKNFQQRQTSYTPGAITYCCSCSHPIIFGFKVLSRYEGPKVVLDGVLSRFSKTPSFLIYDHCCGLYNSAVHSLWWALEDTTVVSDQFHYKNHSCSPGYDPKSYTQLSSTNTVAHEQRNRAINELGRSLRNCSPSLYISLLGFQTTVLNIRARTKGTEAFQNRPPRLSEYDMEWCYFYCLELSCYCC